MDGAAIASLAGTVVALVLGFLAFTRGVRTDARKADNEAFTTSTTGLTVLVGALRAEVDRLRVEVHDCEKDKARMRGEFEAEIRGLKERMEANGA